MRRNIVQAIILFVLTIGIILLLSTPVVEDETMANENVKLPETLIAVGSYGFKDCTGLNDMEVPSGVDQVGYKAFEGINNIWYHGELDEDEIFEGESHKVNNMLKSGICYDADENFYMYAPNDDEAYGVLAIAYGGGNACDFWNWVHREEVMYDASQSGEWIDPELIHDIYFKDDVKHIMIKRGATKVSNNAYEGFSAAVEIGIPDGVEIIEENAFAGCTGVARVDIPSSVTTIEANAFRDVQHIYYNGSAAGAPWGAQAMN